MTEDENDRTTETRDGHLTVVDFGPQARIVARLAEGVRDGQLADATPCPGVAVRNLLGHLKGLAVAFRGAADKNLGPVTDTPPNPAAEEADPDWRTGLPEALDALADSWRDPTAWTGMTRVGGVDLPGAVAGAVLADELVVHAWDLSRATAQPYTPDPAALHSAHGFLRLAAEDLGRTGGAFGPVFPVPAEAPLLDRVVGLSGRDPEWTAGG